VKKWLAILAGAILTGLLLWMVLGGANAWRKAAFPQAPDGGAVRIHFIAPPKR
jgi:hypothetical protein